MNHDAKGKPDKGARHGVSAVSFGARRDRIVLQIPLLQPPNQRRRVLSSGATVCSDPPEPPYTCNALTVCKSYEVETVAPTHFSDRKCANLPGFPQYPLCFCDTLANGMTSAAHGKQACMKWHKNNPFLSAIKASFDQDKLPKPEGPHVGGAQIECILPDKNVKTGAAAEFEKGWQGNCPPDFTKCAYIHERPAWQGACATGCQCDIYKNGAHPLHNADHMCVTTTETETKDGKKGELKTCTPPTNGYEARFGESYMNFGCDHPA